MTISRRAFAVYVAGYTVGRGLIEMMRTDPATMVLGLRINVWVSVLVFLGAVAYFVLAAKRGPREVLGGEPVAVIPVDEVPSTREAAATAADGDGDDDDGDDDLIEDDVLDDDPAADDREGPVDDAETEKAGSAGGAKRDRVADSGE